MSSDPMTIYQEWLDTLSAVLTDDDLDLLPNHISLPYLHQAHDNRTILETEKDLVDGFRVFMATLRAQGANQFIRLASTAQYLSDDYISGAHVTHVLRNATPVVPSFVSHVVLRRTASNWKLVENVGDYAHGAWPVRIMRVTPMDPGANTKDDDDARRQSAQPVVLYQRFLNAMTQANVSGNLDAYCDLCLYPYSAHSYDTDRTVSTREEVKVFFDALTDILKTNNVTDFTREAEHAEFVSGDTICGYHSARFRTKGRDMLDPIKSRIILRRKGTSWFLNSVTNAVAGHIIDMKETPLQADLVSDRKIQERTKI